MRVFVLLFCILTSLTLLIPIVGAGVVLQRKEPRVQATSTPLPHTPQQPTVREEISDASSTSALPTAGADAVASAPPLQPPKDSVAPVLHTEPALQQIHLTRPQSVALHDEATGKTTKVSPAEYVRGALAAEMPPTFHPEALKAQAIAIHTRILYTNDPVPVNLGKNEGYITEKTAKKLYGEKFDLYWPVICKAAAYAMDKVVIYDDEPVLAAYHAMSSGFTEHVDNVWLQPLSYLIPVKSAGDPLAPNYTVATAFSQQELRRLLLAAFPKATLHAGEEQSWIEPTVRSEGGYIIEAYVGGVFCKGTEIRAALGLRSACFEVAYQNGSFTITTQGYGHGVGLSQYGADFMARQGSNAQEILNHYYSGAKVALCSVDA